MRNTPPWMRTASAGALGVALVAFTLNARTDTSLAERTPTPNLADTATRAAGAAETPPPESNGIARPALPDSRDDGGADRADRTGASVDRGDDDRRRRWRRRNRYPGPIPTPAEWEPPEGPVRIGLQVGHWRTDEAPPELNGLRDGGTRWRGVHEWEVNLAIVRRTAALLEEEGYVVDVLPSVVPPGYRAHLFVSVHADGSGDPGATGYRIAAPSQDATGRADGMVALLERTYGEVTGLPLVPTVTRRMRRYYAFNFRRYEHALHPMTIAVILETGFLTSPRDRRVILDDPERPARGIVEAVKSFPVTRLAKGGVAGAR